MPTPALGGMKWPCGLDDVTQFAVEKACEANARNRKMTTSFTATMKLLKRADSLIPIASRIVAPAITATAGTLKMAPVVDQLWLAESKASGADASFAGMLMPISLAKLTT